MVNSEKYHWELYDRTGIEAHTIYFKGYQCTPRFYIKRGEDCYRIDCGFEEIKVFPITEPHIMNSYIKEKCHCTSPQALCWAKALYYTSKPDKPPFDML